ncbi:hypothetical protein AB0D68_11120 [Streptomyces sp. NPDC048212]|uniref:hypothetical protein n=1 Tax=Streptomyces sp. NPDC048212 TaxID=3156658 RepID=UPI003400D24D
MISEQEAKDLSEIQRLLDEAYDHYFKYSDGYCKSSEGYFAVHFDHYFDRKDSGTSKIRAVKIYSYVFGPSRTHDFTSTAEALETVKVWHDREMRETYEEEEWDEDEDYEFRGRW